jgi:hypothetical protein
MPSHAALEFGFNQNGRPSADFHADGSVKMLRWVDDGVEATVTIASDGQSGRFERRSHSQLAVDPDSEDETVFWQADHFINLIYDRVLDRRRCTFCGKTDQEVKTLIAAPAEAFICDECVATCHSILEERS